MSGDTRIAVSGWTIDTLAQHVEALREAQREFNVERDRRYTEVAHEREKALRIKESADDRALMLAREIQTYKDTKANELREQINSERLLYATKADLAALADKYDAGHRPVLEFMAAQTGHGKGAQDSRVMIAWVVAIMTSFIAIGSFVFRQSSPPSVYVTNPSNMQPTTPIPPLQK